MFGNDILVRQCDSIPFGPCISSNDAVDFLAIDLQTVQFLRDLLDLSVVFFFGSLSLLRKIVSFPISHSLKRRLGKKHGREHNKLVAMLPCAFD